MSARRRALLWVAPGVLAAAALYGYPLLGVAAYSVQDVTVFQPGRYVGAENFTALLSDELFWHAVRNNAILLLTVPATIVVGLALAGLLYRGMTGGSVYRSILFTPFLPAVAPVGAVFVYVFSWEGPLNAVLRSSWGEGAAVEWLTDPSIAMWSIAAVVAWKRLGLLVVLFEARLVALPRDQFEACALDGGSWWAAFRYVAVPQMRGVLSFAAVLGAIEVLSWSFAYVLVMTRGGPEGTATYVLEYVLYDLQFERQLLGRASALAALLVVAALALGALRPRREEQW